MRSVRRILSPRPRPMPKRRFGRRSASVSGTRGLRLEPLERRFLLAAGLDFTKVGVLDPTVIDPPDQVDAGDMVAYEYTVKNIGNEVLTDIGVSDSLPGLSDISPAVVETLAPGDVAVFSATYAVTQADLDAGVVSNTATCGWTRTAMATSTTRMCW